MQSPVRKYIARGCRNLLAESTVIGLRFSSAARLGEIMPTSLKVENLSINDLDLDVENPRIRKFLEQYGSTPNFDQMLLALGAGSSDPESGSTVTRV